jgi:hypothetical protein
MFEIAGQRMQTVCPNRAHMLGSARVTVLQPAHKLESTVKDQQLPKSSLLARALQEGTTVAGLLLWKLWRPHSGRQRRMPRIVLMIWHCTSKGAAPDRVTTERHQGLRVLEFKTALRYLQALRQACQKHTHVGLRAPCCKTSVAAGKSAWRANGRLIAALWSRIVCTPRWAS